MAAPTMIAISGSWRKPDGTNANGKVTFTPIDGRFVNNGDVIDQIPVTVPLTAGVISTTLALAVNGYMVHEVIDGVSITPYPIPGVVPYDLGQGGLAADTLYSVRNVNGHAEIWINTSGELDGGVQLTNDQNWDSWLPSTTADGTLVVLTRTPGGTLDKTFAGTLSALSSSTHGATDSATISGDTNNSWQVPVVPFCFAIDTGANTELIGVTNRVGTTLTLVRDVLNTGAPAHTGGLKLLGGYEAATTWTMHPDASSLTQRLGFPSQLSTGQYQKYGSATLKPDGSKVAIFIETTAAATPASTFQIVEVDTTTWLIANIARQITSPGLLFDPTYTPDGALIIFVEAAAAIPGISCVASSSGVNTGYTQLWRQPQIGVVATTNINIASAPATIDGSATGNALLVGQTDPTQNGVYDWNGTGVAMTRNGGFNTGAEVLGGAVHIIGGAHAGTYWECTLTAAPTLGSTPITYVQRSRPLATGPNDPRISADGTRIIFEYQALLPNAGLGYPEGQWDIGRLPFNQAAKTAGPMTPIIADGNVNSRAVWSKHPAHAIYYEKLIYPVVAGFSVWYAHDDGSHPVQVLSSGSMPFAA